MQAESKAGAATTERTACTSCAGVQVQDGAKQHDQDMTAELICTTRRSAGERKRTKGQTSEPCSTRMAGKENKHEEDSQGSQKMPVKYCMETQSARKCSCTVRVPDLEVRMPGKFAVQNCPPMYQCSHSNRIHPLI